MDRWRNESRHKGVFMVDHKFAAIKNAKMRRRPALLLPSLCLAIWTSCPANNNNNTPLLFFCVARCVSQKKTLFSILIARARSARRPKKIPIPDSIVSARPGGHTPKVPNPYSALPVPFRLLCSPSPRLLAEILEQVIFSEQLLCVVLVWCECFVVHHERNRRDALRRRWRHRIVFGVWA